MRSEKTALPNAITPSKLDDVWNNPASGVKFKAVERQYDFRERCPIGAS
jgi:hypothetical protein